MNEVKHERFCRVVEKRNCSSRVSYDYTQEEVQKIIDELDYQLKHLKERFSGKRAFSLSNSGEPDEP